MRYYLDTEFNSFGGALLSLALVGEHGHALYLTYPPCEQIDPWVAEHVMPIMHDTPKGWGKTIHERRLTRRDTKMTGARTIASFLNHFGEEADIITDWPDDIRYFCQAIVTGPGEMVRLPTLRFELHRVDAYPTTITGAVRHNALWDALALYERLKPGAWAENVHAA